MCVLKEFKFILYRFVGIIVIYILIVNFIYIFHLRCNCKKY